MKRKLLRVLTAATVAGSLGISTVPLAQAQYDRSRSDIPKFVALTSSNTLVRYNSKGSFSSPLRVTGVRNNGNLLGIDYRPANQLLYGLSDTNEIYTINATTGAATFVSKLNTPFFGGFQSGVDFNPQVDRLRVVGSNGQNFRINVDTGEVTVDTALTFSSGGNRVSPSITAIAYDRSFTGGPSTTVPPARPTRPTPELYDIGYSGDVLTEQDPPNDGTLTRVGPLGVNFAPIGGFDIFRNSSRNDVGYALSSSSLYIVNLDSGTARKVLSVPNNGFVGLAIRPL